MLISFDFIDFFKLLLFLKYFIILHISQFRNYFGVKENKIIIGKNFVRMKELLIMRKELQNEVKNLERIFEMMSEKRS